MVINDDNNIEKINETIEISKTSMVINDDNNIEKNNQTIEISSITTNEDNYWNSFMKYVSKMKGKDNKLFPIVFPQNDYTYTELLIMTLCSFTYILILVIIDNYYLISYTLNDNMTINILIAAYGASAAIIFGSPMTPFAQPRNVFFGHVNSSIIAILTDEICDILSINTSVKAALALALSILIMKLLRCYHPPGAANGLGYILSPHAKVMKWLYVLTCGVGALVGIIIATIGVNINPSTNYPLYW